MVKTNQDTGYISVLKTLEKLSEGIGTIILQ